MVRNSVLGGEIGLKLPKGSMNGARRRGSRERRQGEGMVDERKQKVDKCWGCSREEEQRQRPHDVTEQRQRG